MVGPGLVSCSLSFGAPLGALVGASFGWAKVFDLLAGLSLVLVLANRRTWPIDAIGPSAPAMGHGSPGILAQRLLPTVIWSTALYGMYTYLGAWLTRLGFSTEQIAQVIHCYGIGAIVGTLGGGRIADRIGPRAATGASLLSLFAAFTLLPLTLYPGAVIGLCFGITLRGGAGVFPGAAGGGARQRLS